MTFDDITTVTLTEAGEKRLLNIVMNEDVAFGTKTEILFRILHIVDENPGITLEQLNHSDTVMTPFEINFLVRDNPQYFQLQI